MRRLAREWKPRARRRRLRPEGCAVRGQAGRSPRGEHGHPTAYPLLPSAEPRAASARVGAGSPVMSSVVTVALLAYLPVRVTQRTGRRADGISMTAGTRPGYGPARWPARRGSRGAAPDACQHDHRVSAQVDAVGRTPSSAAARAERPPEQCPGSRRGDRRAWHDRPRGAWT